MVPLLGRDARNLGWQPLRIIWTIWRERHSVAFDNKDFSAEGMKSSFICNFWSWTNLSMVDRPRSLVCFLTCWVVDEVWCV